MQQPIIQFPSPSLSRPCRPVEFPLADSVRSHIADMRETLGHTPNGLALASNQILEDGLRIFVSNHQIRMPEVVINPSWERLPIEEESGPFYTASHDSEGCLSIPGAGLMVRRYSLIRLRYQDEEGTQRETVLRAFEARIVQHECDHLDGRTILDHAPKEVKYRLRSEIIRRRKAGGG